MEEQIVCPNCQSTDYTTEFKHSQQTAWCKDCGSFIKNIPYKPATFYFGKYKGTPVAECMDADYMEWFLATAKPKPYMKTALKNRIRALTEAEVETQESHETEIKRREARVFLSEVLGEPMCIAAARHDHNNTLTFQVMPDGLFDSDFFDWYCYVKPNDQFFDTPMEAVEQYLKHRFQWIEGGRKKWNG